jgi:hypothetical protein
VTFIKAASFSRAVVDDDDFDVAAELRARP